MVYMAGETALYGKTLLLLAPAQKLSRKPLCKSLCATQVVGTASHAFCFQDHTLPHPMFYESDARDGVG